MEKFLFNNNIFNDAEDLPAPETDDVKQPEAEPEMVPLPPMFTEEEVEKARQDSFEKGRQDGIQETKSAHEVQNTEILNNLVELLEQKTTQDQKSKEYVNTYALRLAIAMFEKSLPILQNKYGLDDLKDHIENILSANASETSVTLHIHPDMIEPFGPYIAELKKRNAELQCSVQGDERLSLYGCNITWENGGGQIDQVAIADKVMHSVNQILAGTDIKGDDDGSAATEENTHSNEITVPESNDGEAT